MKARRPSFAVVAAILVAVLAVVTAVVALDGTGRWRPAADAPAIGGPFTLAGAGGRVVTDRDLLGRPFAIFFGYTRCPDVCPTTLAEIDAARDAIGPAADALTVVFVSVDPEHDTPDQVQDFVGSFAHPVLGLTGTAAEIDAVTRAYGVYFAKVPQPDGDFLIDHTAAVFLMDAVGRFAAAISYDEDHDSRVAKLRRLIGGA